MRVDEYYEKIQQYEEVEVAAFGKKQEKGELVGDISARSSEYIFCKIASEHTIQIQVDGKPYRKVVCTAEYLADLVLGRLLCDGIIDDTGDVDTILLDASGKTAKVFLTSQGRTKNKVKNLVRHLNPVTPLKWEKSWIYSLTELFERNLPLYEATGSAHFCYLMVDGKVLFQCEDIRRHNTVDKMIGYALRTGVELKKAVAYISGRMPVDMVYKFICAGIPVLVSKSLPTKEAVELGRAYGLTIIGEAKQKQFKVFTVPFAAEEEIFRSKKNQVRLVWESGRRAVKKQFRQAEAYQMERMHYEMLGVAGVPVPQVLECGKDYLLLSYIEGKDLAELLEEQTREGCFRAEIWEMLAEWMICCARKTGVLVKDRNLRNFIFSEAKQRVYGIDFEEGSEPCILSGVAELSAFVRIYDLPDESVRGKVCCCLRERLCKGLGLDTVLFAEKEEEIYSRLLERKKNRIQEVL